MRWLNNPFIETDGLVYGSPGCRNLSFLALTYPLVKASKGENRVTTLGFFERVQSVVESYCNLFRQFMLSVVPGTDPRRDDKLRRNAEFSEGGVGGTVKLFSGFVLLDIFSKLFSHVKIALIGLREGIPLNLSRLKNVKTEALGNVHTEMLVLDIYICLVLERLGRDFLFPSIEMSSP